MIGRTQAIARARRTRSVSGGKAQYHELGSGFLKKLIPLMIAVSLATSMIPAAALANDVDAAETASAAGVAQTTDVVDADSNTGANQTDDVEDDAAQAPASAVDSADGNTDAPNDANEEPLVDDEGNEGLSTFDPAPGAGSDTVTQPAATIEVKCGIIGVDAAGNAQAWAPEKAFDVKQGATAADATVAAFEAAGIEAKYDPDGAYGFYLGTITSPYDGRVLGWDEATGRYWQLFVNGEASSVGASDIELSMVTWSCGRTARTVRAFPKFRNRLR
ncbi:MAG: DUF4430 domain-containing protein [Eggerthellaceae bacterium]